MNGKFGVAHHILQNKHSLDIKSLEIIAYANSRILGSMSKI